MVIESLKAQIAALNGAMKEKGVPETVVKTLKESAAGLQKLLDKAREAAKEAKEEGYEEEAGMPGEEEEGGHVMPHKVAAGHKVTKTVTVKHDGPDGDGEEEESGDEPDPKDSADDGDEKDDDKDGAEESRKVHLELLLKEAGIPQEICKAEQLIKMGLKEAKAAIAEKKALIEVARKAIDHNMDFVPVGEGRMSESTGGENLNSLFTGCAE